MEITDQAALLENVVQALLKLLEQQPSMAELKSMVALRQQALDLFPLEHSDRSSKVFKLADTLSFYYSRTRLTEKLDESIQRYRESLALVSPDDPVLSARLNGLASALFDRFAAKKSLEDEAIVLSRESLTLWPQGHPDRGASAFTLGMSLGHLYFRTHRIEDLNEFMKSSNSTPSAILNATEMHHVSMQHRYILRASSG